MTEITVNANININGMTYEDIVNFMHSQQKALLSVMSKDKWMTCEEILAAYQKEVGNYYTTGAGIVTALDNGEFTYGKVEHRKKDVSYYTCLCDEHGNPIGKPVQHKKHKSVYRLR